MCVPVFKCSVTSTNLILTIILIFLASISKLENDASKLLTVFIGLKMGVQWQYELMSWERYWGLKMGLQLILWER